MPPEFLQSMAPDSQCNGAGDGSDEHRAEICVIGTSSILRPEDYCGITTQLDWRS